MENEKKLNIKSWAEPDRPREKLIQKGRQALTDAELLAILLGSGTRTLSAVDLAKQILHANKNNLNELAKQTLNDLTKFKGIGQAKAISIVAALELARRKPHTEQLTNQPLTSSKLMYEVIAPNLTDLDHEQFWIILLNRSMKLIRSVQVSAGGVAGTFVDNKIIFKHALENLATGLVLAHNHPSGNLQPSQADISITKKITEIGKLLDIRVLDHIIVANNNYYSFCDNDLL